MRATLFVTLALVALPGTALAADPPTATTQTTPTTPTTTTPTKPTTPTTKPTPPVAKKGKLSVQLQRIYSVHRKRTVLTGQKFRIRAIVRPFVANQKLKIRVYRHGKKIGFFSRRMFQPHGAAFGRVTIDFKSAKTGTLTVTVSHAATPELATLVATPAHVQVVSGHLSQGARGPAVTLLQEGLAKLHFAVPSSGVYDGGTGRAVMAFRKVNHLGRTYSANLSLLRRVLTKGRTFKVRYPHDGKHAEGDLGLQVLALINKNGSVYRIYHMSSGKPSTPTVLGRFRVYSQELGTNSHGMVDSNYFIRGYAIHGYFDVPPYNASHGCLRVPIPNARAIHDWLNLGDIVDVYYR